MSKKKEKDTEKQLYLGITPEITEFDISNINEAFDNVIADTLVILQDQLDLIKKTPNMRMKPIDIKNMTSILKGLLDAKKDIESFNQENKEEENKENKDVIYETFKKTYKKTN